MQAALSHECPVKRSLRAAGSRLGVRFGGCVKVTTAPKMRPLCTGGGGCLDSNFEADVENRPDRRHSRPEFPSPSRTSMTNISFTFRITTPQLAYNSGDLGVQRSIQIIELIVLVILVETPLRMREGGIGNSENVSMSVRSQEGMTLEVASVRATGDVVHNCETQAS